MLLPLTGDAFYVSGTFWLTVVLVVMTLALIVIGVWAVIVARGKKVLVWTAASVDLVRADSRLDDGLEVSWNGQRLSRPTISTIELINEGRHDISTAMFDNAQPISIALTTPIIGLIEPPATEEAGVLPVRLDGKCVLVGPGLFRSGDQLAVVVLTDGEPMVSPEFPLIDVKIATVSRAERLRTRADQVARIAAVVSPIRLRF